MYVVDLNEGIAFLVLSGIVVGALWWAHVVSQGVKFRPVLLGLLSVGYVLFFFSIETGNWLGVDDVAPLDLTLLVVTGVIAYLVSFGSTRVLYNRKGELGYREGPMLMVVWLVLLLLEVFVQQAVLGQVTIFHLVIVRGIPSPTPVDPTAISHPYQVVVTTVDALFAMGTGLELGDNAALYSSFARARLKRGTRR